MRDDITSAKARLHNNYGTGREINKLPDHLAHGETVVEMAGGRYDGGQGLLVLTSHRLLFLRSGFLSQATEDFPLDRVSSVQWKSLLGTGKITIVASGTNALIESVNASDGKRLVDSARARLAGVVGVAPTPTVFAPVAPAPTVFAPVAPPSPPIGATAGSGLKSGWFPDPSGAHEQRYFDGLIWTAHVTNAGRPSVDEFLGFRNEVTPTKPEPPVNGTSERQPTSSDEHSNGLSLWAKIGLWTVGILTVLTVIGLFMGEPDDAPDEPATMPDVVGKQLDVAKRDLSAADADDVEVVGGGVFGVVDESAWTVCEQHPSPGAEIGEVSVVVDRECGSDEAAADTTTSMAVSTGPPPLMPDIGCGMDLQYAFNLIHARATGEILTQDATGEHRTPFDLANWTVVRQTPAPGQVMVEGQVMLTVVKDDEFWDGYGDAYGC